MDILPTNQHVLIAVLDWGLGHASRSMALAQQLEQRGNYISWASAGRALEMLRREYPTKQIHELPAYDIQYQGPNMSLNIASQLPKIWRVIRQEKKVIEALINRLSSPDFAGNNDVGEQSSVLNFKVARPMSAARNNTDTAELMLISDSRFGCYSDQVKSVLLTHQLQPIFGVPLAKNIYRRFLQRFDEFWVPDQGGENNLSGKLSDPEGYHPVKFIGCLSRLHSVVVDADETKQRSEDLSPLPAGEGRGEAEKMSTPSNAVTAFDHVCLLSGPEPQRTYLEESLLQKLKNQPGQHLIIQGIPGQRKDVNIGNCRLISYTNGAETAGYLLAAKKIICRSGYSTLMDLKALGKPAILVPTPGQTEQIYLAKRAVFQGWAEMGLNAI